MSGNSWLASKPLQPKRWDTNCPGAVPAPQSSCPKHTLPRVPLGQLALVPWSLSEWQGYFAERAAIRQHDGGLSRSAAERAAWVDTLARWLATHPPSEVVLSVWPPDLLRPALLAEATAALERLGIAEPPRTSRP